jgi:hypothetical protein
MHIKKQLSTSEIYGRMKKVADWQWTNLKNIIDFQDVDVVEK